MTNFFNTQPRKAPWFTPERLVLVLPVAGGALVSTLLLVLVLPPLLQQVKQRSEAIKLLEAQQRELPALRLQVLDRQVQVQRKEQQHQRLLALVAGTAQLRTWISGLNDLAAATKVTVTQVEPGPLEVYTPPQPPPANGQPPTDPAQAAATAPAPSTDPLLVEGLQKRSATITLRGSYRDLRRFLQRLEALEVIAITSDLDFKATAQGSPAGPPQGGGAQQPPLELKLKLSAYGRAPAKAATSGS